MIVVDPEVRVPVYKRGRIIRVSIVREADAASLFTRIGSITEERTRMKREIKDALADFFCTDDAATKFLDTFGIDVDEINRTVEDDNLIHRTKTKTKPAATAKAKTKPAPKTVKQAVADAKKKVAAAAAKETEDDEPEDDEDEVEDEVDETEEPETQVANEPIELDEEAMAELAAQVADHPVFQAVIDAVTELENKVDELTKARTADAKEIAVLKAAAQKASTRLANVEKDEGKKKSEYQQDMPARNSRKATFRPRKDEVDEDDDEQEEENSSDIAERTLAKIPTRY
jgi:hypothetical protein